MEVRPHRTLEQLQQIERGEKNAGRAKRLRIIILAIEGWTAPSIAMAVGLSRRAVQDWVARYNADGMQGLEDGRGKGTHPPLDEVQQAQFVDRIEAGPTDDDAVCSLRGKDFQKILEAEFGLLRSLSSVYGLLHKLGYSYLKPRPKHPKSDPAAVELFKATWSERLRKIADEHAGKRLRVYRSFHERGRTSHASASKAPRPTSGPGPTRVRKPCGRPSTNTCGARELSDPKRVMPKDCSVYE